ncbi:MAG: hypothetical protein JO171_07495 [Paludibacterium sp.]|uniref:hypothetical protein n=1 Tax=Paludibacterium sp. TaxID=1917523 RepID=UPI0025D0E17B|nr:hypothetical protein [Paludibacterium sp.]MBV8046978.1 hypothetical protein [Paludibacterium sp.]MBV8648110.1 hypothetical protein [Paludibacterium sp.]
MFVPAGSQVWSRQSGALAWLYVVGPWDAERVRAAREYFEEARAVKPLPEPWGLIVVALASAECVPEALLALRAAALRDIRREGRAATAWVMSPELAGRSVMGAVLHSVYQDIGPMEVFDNEGAAETWLRAQLSGLARG